MVLYQTVKIGKCVCKYPKSIPPSNFLNIFPIFFNEKVDSISEEFGVEILSQKIFLLKGIYMENRASAKIR